MSQLIIEQKTAILLLGDSLSNPLLLHIWPKLVVTIFILNNTLTRGKAIINVYTHITLYTK